MNQPEETTSTKICATTVFDELTTQYQGEVTALAEAAKDDFPMAVSLLRSLIEGTRALGEEDATSRIALGIRDHFGLSPSDTPLVTELTAASNDLFEAVCAELLR